MKKYKGTQKSETCKTFITSLFLCVIGSKTSGPNLFHRPPSPLNLLTYHYSISQTENKVYKQTNKIMCSKKYKFSIPYNNVYIQNKYSTSVVLEILNFNIKSKSSQLRHTHRDQKKSTWRSGVNTQYTQRWVCIGYS